MTGTVDGILRKAFPFVTAPIRSIVPPDFEVSKAIGVSRNYKSVGVDSVPLKSSKPAVLPRLDGLLYSMMMMISWCLDYFFV